MHSLLFLPKILVTTLLCVPALARFDLAKRLPQLVCVQDDLYDGFHNADPEDIDPWCSSYLGIPEYTATRVGGTSRTTVITTTTTFTPYFQTTTALSYITTTTVTAGAPQKRDAAPEPTPAPSREQLYMVAPLLQQCDESEANKSVISSVSSACSCLFILPRTVDVSVVTTVTRTRSAIDYQSTPVYVTKQGNATLTETVYPTNTPSNNSSLPGSNGTLSTSSTFTSKSVSKVPKPSRNASSSLSSVPATSSISSLSLTSSTTVLPSSSPTCVVEDGLIVTQKNGESFQALCFTNFTGPTSAGLDVPTYRSCLQQCAHINDGFSLLNCYGVSYFPDRLGPNCYLKTKDEVAVADYNPNYRIVSGRLLLNGTNVTSSSASLSSTSTPAINTTLKVGPTGPTAPISTSIPGNVTSYAGPTSPISGTAPPASFNSTVQPSITASPSFNASITPSPSSTDNYDYTFNITGTSDPRNGNSRPTSSGTGASSGFPTPSANVTSGGFPTPSANGTSGFPTPTANGTSGFPIPTANGTSGFPIPTSNGTSSGFPSPSANLTSSGFPTPSGNDTSYGTSGLPSPTSNGTSSGFPTPSANASTCFFTNYLTETTTLSVCESYVSTVYTTAPKSSIGSTKTITQTLTIAV